MKTVIYISFNYGAYSINFSKDFNFPFMPFENLSILDSNGNEEYLIELKSNDYCDVIFQYDINHDYFSIDVRNIWKWPVSNECIDETIEALEALNWKREDRTDINTLKELMSRDYIKIKI